MILFRADGNSKIGSGHITRCLALADAFRELKQSVVFVTADDSFQNVIRKQGYESIILYTEYDHMEDELSILASFLHKLCPQCVLLDSYFVTLDYMKAIRKETSLVYIDDQNAFDYPADMVINYSLYADKLSYPQNKCYLMGPEYALLRKEFQNIPQRRAATKVKHVLFSTGGADGEHVALECIRYLKKLPVNDVTYHFVLGAMNQDVVEIERLAVGYSHIVIHQNVSDMRSLMLQCDAAISAGGTTLFELCACGVPTVTYVLADNQIMNATSFEEAGLMLCAGDVRKVDQFAERIFERLEALMRDQSLRQRMTEQMQVLVNGYGANRMAEAIVEKL